MDIKEAAIVLFDFYTYLVIFNKKDRTTFVREPLLDKSQNPVKIKYVELKCTAAGILSVTAYNQLPAGYVKNNPYDFDNSDAQITTAYDVFLTEPGTDPAEVVIGVGDIRDLTTMKRAKLHKYRLLNGIVLSATSNNIVTVYYKSDADVNMLQYV